MSRTSRRHFPCLSRRRLDVPHETYKPEKDPRTSGDMRTILRRSQMIINFEEVLIILWKISILPTRFYQFQISINPIKRWITIQDKYAKYWLKSIKPRKKVEPRHCYDRKYTEKPLSIKYMSKPKKLLLQATTGSKHSH